MFDLCHPGAEQATHLKGDSSFQLDAVSPGRGVLSDNVTTCLCRVITLSALHFLECLSNLSKPVWQHCDAESNNETMLLLPPPSFLNGISLKSAV